MQRDKLVLSQLLKTIDQEENPTLNVSPRKRDKVKLQEAILRQNDPARSIRKEEGKDEGCMRVLFMELQRNSVSPHWGRGTTQVSVQVTQESAPVAFASVEWHLQFAKHVHHVSLFGASLITSVYNEAKENNHHLPLPLPAKPCSAAF